MLAALACWKPIDQVDEALLAAAKEAKDRRARAQAFDEFRILMLDASERPLQADPGQETIRWSIWRLASGEPQRRR